MAMLWWQLPLLTLFFLWVRIFPIWPRRNRGCDAYYFLLSAETFRRERRLPIVFDPHPYLLEPAEQWYPPLFPILMGLLSPRWLRRYYWSLNHLIDLVALWALFFLVYSQFGLIPAILAAIIYTFSPNLISEFSALTSRSLGLLVFLPFMGALFHWHQSPDPLSLLLVTLAGVVLLYTHKLTVQLMVFMMVFLALGWRLGAGVDWVWLAPLPAIYLAALLVGRGYFIDILRAHWDIVTFWNRNWRLFGAHAIHGSPLYPKGHKQAQIHSPVFGQNMLKRLLLQGKAVFLLNPAVLLVLLNLAAFRPFYDIQVFMLFWTAGTYLWATATIQVPFLRCLGEGTKYIKYAEFPVIFLASPMVMGGDMPDWHLWIIAVWLCLHLAYYLFTVYRQRSGEIVTGVESPELQVLLKIIEALPHPRVVCLPTALSDLTAYVTRKEVLWGTHGYGFKRVGNFYPVLRHPLGHLVNQHALTHLLLDRTYVDPQEIGLEDRNPLASSGRYLLYSLDPPPGPGLLATP
ncbi:MAG: hypothetical protein HQL82_02525 [Magnetococcales bacterium]|nr:hypothetical protein [Magnetococcales bacterium]